MKIWPFSLLAEIAEDSRLRRECLSELIDEVIKQGIEASDFISAITDYWGGSLRDMVEAKRTGSDYSLEIVTAASPPAENYTWMGVTPGNPKKLNIYLRVNT